MLERGLSPADEIRELDRFLPDRRCRCGWGRSCKLCQGSADRLH
jgi:hypothetical protein